MTHSTQPRLLAAIVGVLTLASCDRPSTDAPPAIALGQDVCDQCNMILSDERFATATIIQGPRGPEARLFDDFNCQAQYESLNDDQKILARWSHDHETLAWLKSESGYFLLSDRVRAPMGSQLAAFASRDAAERAQGAMPGQILSFGQAWDHLVPEEEDRPKDGG